MRKFNTSHEDWIKTNVSYAPLTGNLFWLLRARGRRVNKPLGCVDSKGYIKVQFNYVADYAHRVGWFLYYGVWPQNEIDHINGRPSDNRIVNLRDVTTSVNQLNRGLMRTNTTGIQGASWSLSGRYKVTKCGRHLGTFDTAVEAIRAYDNEKI